MSKPSRCKAGGHVLTSVLLAGLFWLASFVSPVIAQQTLWSLDQRAAPTVDLKKSLRPGSHPIQFDPKSLAKWLPGEFGDLPLPGGRLYRIRAHRVEEHSSGNRSWTGKYDVNGKTYVAVLTYGPDGLVGEIRTPDGPVIVTIEDGQVVLVDVNEAGWTLPEIAESDAMVQPAFAKRDIAQISGAPVEFKVTPSPQNTIDVLVAYTSGMVSRAGSVSGALLRLDQLIAFSNQAYVDSEVAITLRLAHSVQVAYTDADDNSAALNNLTNGSGVFASVKTTLRDRYGADIVVLVRPFNYPAQVGCGVAWVGGYNNNGAAIGNQSANGFAVVSDGNDINGTGYFCQNATFPHELGHNMGAMHDRQTVTQGGTASLEVGAYSYSYGYVANASWSAAQGQNTCNGGAGSSCFGTIMSYLTKVSELRFSNPGLANCPAGQSCGTASDNVALTLNNTRAAVAGWRATKVPFTGTLTGSGQSAAINAQFSLPLKVTIRDAANQLVPGVTVTFAGPTSGALATLSAASAVTDANGVAQVTATANGTAGPYTVVATATSGRVSSPFSFTLTNSGGNNPVLSIFVGGSGTVTGPGINCPGACSAAPAAGSVITLSAIAGAGSAFTGWLGGQCTGVGICMVTVDTAKTVRATFGAAAIMPVKFDIDLSAKYDALTDGLLVLRYLSGLSGTALTAGATGPGALRTDPTAVLSYLGTIAPQLDIDGDGAVDPTTDGALIVRYLFGLRGNALIGGALSNTATRTTAQQIEAYIAARLP
ncbi:MAG: reprolysin-like metallopeptidase [Betaproteobacteria bacterium]